jgi:D-3-phosphoglycerate dehydrogenase
MNILFFRDPDVWGLLRPAAEMVRATGHQVRVVPRRVLHGPGAGGLADVAEDVLATAEIIIAAPRAPVTAAMMDQAPRLRALVSPVGGVDSFDLPEAARRGIIVAHGGTDEQFTSMAESTLALLLALAYRVPALDRIVRGGWRDPAAGPGLMLRGKTVGLWGYGPIGERVAARLAGWDMRLIASTRSRAPGETDGPVTFVDRETLLAESDILSLHLREVPETRGILDRAGLAQMKPGALLVNTARGSLVDEAAMVEALVSGHLAGAALDCFDTEPLPGDSPLRDLTNVILTPHNVGHTRALFGSMAKALLENLSRLAVGEAPAIARNPEVLEAWQARWGQANAGNPS